ncbi:hypothetical protein A2890_01760 [candidate division WWE3 bacterium RIFCSPLOWO2_01_FULL_53_14]|uniref:YwbE family protein n=1 Tax=candidate division WWE3 bacterium RIFCSPLOWO2_01_FULL_53_14 TaxID=1802628 RepID=A0A1F4VSN8_UNCKA|nr:MAG: hypothetical protein A2890_01760 [candidate division WWE3 bacterium RIFCSPLOWO2_01_FULL_53_14]
MVPARNEIKIGQKVWAIEKRNYGTEDLTEGVVQRILTSAPFHPRGIKVMFEDGTVARVQRLTPPEKKVEPAPNPPAEDDLR